MLLNKCDLASKELISATEKAIKSLNDSISIYKTVKGEVPLDKVLNLDAFKARPQLSLDFGQEDHSHDEDDSHNHDHFRGVSSISFPLPIMSPEQEKRLDLWLQKLLWADAFTEKSETEATSLKILRCKGVYWTQNGNQAVIQGVQSIYEITTVASEQVPLQGKLVLIGTGLGDDLKRSLNDSIHGEGTS